MKQFILILRGVSGCGKSTFSKKIKSFLEKNGIDISICETDDYFLKNGTYKWDFNKLGKAHDFCFNKCC